MIRDVATELRSVAKSTDDAAGYFPALYSHVTTQIARSIEGGEFADGERMNVFATEFASRYLRAFRREITRPRCWQATWDVADEGLLIVQHLLLGINAHVNYDLPQSVAAVARESHDLEGARADFDAVNDVLSATSVDVLRNLDRVSRWTSNVAALGGGRMFNFSLRAARTPGLERGRTPLRTRRRATPYLCGRAGSPRLGARVHDRATIVPHDAVRRSPRDTWKSDNPRTVTAVLLE